MKILFSLIVLVPQVVAAISVGGGAHFVVWPYRENGPPQVLDLVAERGSSLKFFSAPFTFPFYVQHNHFRGVSRSFRIELHAVPE